MKRLTQNYKDYVSRFPEEYRKGSGYSMESDVIYERLGAYEDLEEQGKLIILPCDIGSRVYEIYQFLGEGAWEIEEHKIRLEDLEKIGKTVFLTREEAEVAISEQRKEGKRNG